MSTWTTPRQIPAATPASTALPPALSTRAPASAASGWPAEMAQRDPMVWVVWVGVYCPFAAELCSDAESSAIVVTSYAKCYAAGMGRPPLIGLTMSTTPDGIQTNTPPRSWLNDAYLQAVQQAGGIPVLLPPNLE